MTHKLATWGDQFDTFGCVGCGRCITWCPVAIDITEEVLSAPRQRWPEAEGRAMKAMDALIAEAPAFAGLAPKHLELIGGCATSVRAAAGEYLFRRTGPTSSTRSDTDRWRWSYTCRHVRRSRSTRCTTGTSRGLWLFPPHKWEFDGRAREDTALISFDGACLRGKCEADHELGYELMQRFAQVISAPRPTAYDSWMSTASALRLMVPERFRVAERRRETVDTWTLQLEPVDRPGGGVRAGAVHDAVRVRRRGGADLDQRRSGMPERLVHGARGGRRQRGHLPHRAGADAGRARPLRQSLAGRRAPPEDVVIVAGGIGLAPLRPVVYEVLATRERSRAPRCCTAAASRSQLLYTGELEEWRARAGRRGDGRHRARRMARPRGGGADADRARPVRPGTPSRSCAGPRR